MNAKDIMTSPAISVAPGMPVDELAALLCEHRISAAPVLDRARLVGIVSEADLLHRHEIGTDCAFRGHPWWLRVFSADRSLDDYVKSHARHVLDVMTRDVATVAPAASLAEIATLLERRRIRRVPVAEKGVILGMVSRSDLVRALAAARSRANAERLDDEAIKARLVAELRRQSWWLPDLATVTVEQGVVTYEGIIELEHLRSAARAAAEAIPSVRGVVDRRVPYGKLHAMV